MKTHNTFLILALGIIMLSCRPEDIPDNDVSADKARISAIWIEEVVYFEKSYDLGYTWHFVDSIVYEKELHESWEWDGYNPISYSRGYYKDGNRFFYDEDGRLLKFFDGYQEEYLVTYEDEHISKVERYYHGELNGNYDMSYAGGKLTQVVLTEQDAHGYTYKHFFELDWSGENLSKEVRKFVCDFYEDMPTSACFNAYDERRNPFYGYDAILLYLLKTIDEDQFCRLSQNNCTDMLGSLSFPCTMEFTYDERGFPLTETRYYNHIMYDTEDNSLDRTRGEMKYIYEYLD